MSVTPSTRLPGTPGTWLHDALRYWEPRRIAYNLVLAGVVAAWLVFTWPRFRSAVTWPSLMALLALAALANACYCAAYVVEAALQRSSSRELWLRSRWILWLSGALFAAVLACYWIADEIYPHAG